MALDYLLKTSGPFGFSKRPAEEQEKVFLAASAQAVVLKHSDLIDTTYLPSSHHGEISRLQRLTRASSTLEHPYHSRISLPAAVNAHRVRPQAHRWLSFLTLITDKRVSVRQFAAIQKNPGRARTFTGKADWANDIILCGYLMGLLPDVQGSRREVRGYLDKAWKHTNQWMEGQHNYVQWWFPIDKIGMGDGIAPRTLITTTQTLTDHPDTRSAVQEMLMASFIRKVTFWGCQLNATPKIVPLSLAEDKALGKAAYGKTWQENWVISTHNYLRLDRLLLCLHYFGLTAHLDNLYIYLQEMTSSQPDGHRMKESLRRFWSQSWQGKSPLG